MGIVVPFPSAAPDGRRGAVAVGAPRRLASSIAFAERLLDWVAVVCGVLLPFESYRPGYASRLARISSASILEAAALFGLMVVLLLEKHGEYRPYLSLLAVRETERMLRVGAECLLVALPFIFLAAPALPTTLLLTCFGTVPLVLAMEKAWLRVAIRRFRMAGYGNRRAVILGGGPLAKSIYSALLRSPKLGLDPVAIVDEEAALNGTEIRASSYWQGQSALVLAGPLSAQLFRNMRASTLIVADPSLDNAETLDIMARAATLGVSTYIVSRDYLDPGYWLEYSEIDGMMLASLAAERQRSVSDYAKRAVDILLACFALLLLAAPCALAALLIRLTSRGPAIFRQLRVGHKGRLFYLHKFRSMYVDSPTYAFSPTTGFDSRITPIGRLLRRTCFDEVPQLWNVLRGEMSLVGPRPEMPFIVRPLHPAPAAEAGGEAGHHRAMAVERRPQVPHPREPGIRPLLPAASKPLHGLRGAAAYCGVRGARHLRMLPPVEHISTANGQLRHVYLAEPPRELLLPEILQVLRRRRLAIAGCTLAGLLLAIFYVLLRDPRYEALSQIEVTPANTNGLGLDELAAKALNPNDSTLRLQAAVKVLQSNSLALDVIDRLGLAQDKAFAGRWVQPGDMRPSEWAAEARDHLLRRFQKSLSVELVPKTDIVAIRFRARDPELAAAVVNVVVEKFRERNLRTSYESASQVSDWLSKQLEDLKTEVRVSQERLATLDRSSGLLGQDETDNIVFGKLKQLDEQLTEQESDRIVKEARYRIAASGDPGLLASTVPDITLQALRTQQVGLRGQYAQLSSKYGSGYPKILELADQMAAADAAVNRELTELRQRYRNDYEAALHSEQMLRASFEEQKQKAYRLNEDAAQHAILKREVESTQQLYETLQLKLKQAGIAAGLASANIEVIDPAQVPSEPSEPKPFSATLIGLGAGLLCGAALALGLESTDDSVRTPEEVEQAAGVPALGAIPRWHRSARSRFASRKGPRDLEGDRWDRALMLREPASMAAESYRAACHSLLLASQPLAPRVIAIASALPLEGKTTTAANCAISLAQHGAKVLLVDADLRQPSLHDYFGLDLQPGLRDQLREAAGLDLACEITQQPGLWVLPAGSSDAGSSGVLDNRSIQPLMMQWREAYECVVIDTPPLSLVSDALVHLHMRRCGGAGGSLRADLAARRSPRL